MGTRTNPPFPTRFTVYKIFTSTLKLSRLYCQDIIDSPTIESHDEYPPADVEVVYKNLPQRLCFLEKFDLWIPLCPDDIEETTKAGIPENEEGIFVGDHLRLSETNSGSEVCFSG
jgi:hypothetical protein